MMVKLVLNMSRWLLVQCSLWPVVFKFWSAFGFDINRNDNVRGFAT